MTYDNIKNCIKAWFHPLFKRYLFGKATEGVKLTPLAFLGLPIKYLTIKYFDNSVVFLYYSCLKSLLWFRNRTLKDVSAESK